MEFVSDVKEFTKELFMSSGKDAWLIGGADTISFLLNHGLIDEIILSIIPVVLGKGIPLFNEIQKKPNLNWQKQHSMMN